MRHLYYIVSVIYVTVLAFCASLVLKYVGSVFASYRPKYDVFLKGYLKKQDSTLLAISGSCSRCIAFHVVHVAGSTLHASQYADICCYCVTRVSVVFTPRMSRNTVRPPEQETPY